MNILFFTLNRIISLIFRNRFILLPTLFFFNFAKAQLNSSNLVVQDTSTAIEEKLVQLALKGPQIDNTAHLNKINQYQLKAAQNIWLNLLAFSVNINEQTLAKTTTAQSYVYPKYNLGVTVPLGTIFSKTGVKSAKESVEIGKNNQDLLERSIREQVLTSYKEYVAYSKLIVMQSELVNDVQTQLVQSEEKFRNGSISIEAYNSAQKSNNAEMAVLINLKLQQDLKKLELEKMIGVKLETVLAK